MAWKNWAGTVAVTPLRIEHPTSTQAVADIVRSAAEEGVPVKAVGAGHSFTDIAAAPGVQLDLSALRGVVDVDRANRLVTVKADTRLNQMPGLLRPHGLAMENLGDIDAQSIAGAISTGTHGTGKHFGGVATQVRGLTLVDGTGTVHRITGEDVVSHVVSLGALGVLTEVTLQCVDTFVLDAIEKPEPLETVLNDWAGFIDAWDHFEFYWFPHTKVALTKAQNRLPGDAPLKPLARWQRRIDDDLLANRLYEVLCRAGTVAPRVIPRINRLATGVVGDRAHTDLSTNVYTTKRNVRFKEMEFALPVDALPTVLREIDRLVQRRGWCVSFPLECRAAAGDDLWMSTAYGRPTAYIAVHRYHREDHQPYFTECEKIVRAHGGRPHWGKMHTMSRPDFAEIYPKFDDFLALRDTLDPQRVFTNAYLGRVLGR